MNLVETIRGFGGDDSEAGKGKMHHHIMIMT